MQRSRLPRVFYGKEKFMKSFLPLDAEIFAFLQTVDDGRFAAVSYIDTILVHPESERDMMWIIISVEKLLVVSGFTHKILLMTDMHNVQYIKCQKEYIGFQFYKPVKRDLISRAILDEQVDMVPLARILHKDEQFIIDNKGSKISSYIEKLIVNVMNYYNIDKEFA